MGHVSVAAYAKHRGDSRQAVYRSIATGRIKRSSDGLIDADQADRDWANRTQPSIDRGKRKVKSRSGWDDVRLTMEEWDAIMLQACRNVAQEQPALREKVLKVFFDFLEEHPDL
jgi:hypothetical protein